MLIKLALFARVITDQSLGDLPAHVGHGALHALASVTVDVAVAQLRCFVGAGRSAGWRDGAAFRAILQLQEGFDRRVAARVENLECVDFCDAHETSSIG